MEQYLRRNRLSEVLDGLGVRLLIYLGGILWFVWLWGLGTAAVLAGLSLGTLGQLARTKWRQHTVARREKALRSRLGGELMLEDILLAGAKEAHFQAALLLSEKWPLTILSAQADGTLCRQGKETLLVQCLRIPPEGDLSHGDLISAQRTVKQAKADRGVLCVLGRVSAKVAAKAEGTPIPLRIIRREMLLSIAGGLSPATDAQLVALGKRRQRTADIPLAALIFRPDKARRYSLYGVMILLLYLLTDAGLYAVAGMVCLVLAVFSRCSRQNAERL